jgi:hypothetical protein
VTLFKYDDPEELRALCSEFDLTFEDTHEFWRELYASIAVRAIQKIGPIVADVGDFELKRDFIMLTWVVLKLLKPAWAHEDHKIRSGHRGRDTKREIMLRNLEIQCEAAKLISEQGTSRGVSGQIKKRLNLDLSERQIRNIIKPKTNRK